MVQTNKQTTNTLTTIFLQTTWKLNNTHSANSLIQLQEDDHLQTEFT